MATITIVHQVRGALGCFFNPERIAALSLGLRGTSYPRNGRRNQLPTLKGLKHPPDDRLLGNSTVLQPLQG